MAFHAGQLVICVDDAIHPGWAPRGYRYVGNLDGLTKGLIYTIRDPHVAKTPGEGGSHGVRLHEIVRSGHTTGFVDEPFDASRFRAIDERRLDLFRQRARRTERANERPTPCRLASPEAGRRREPRAP
jgi:hypothetical protein